MEKCKCLEQLGNIIRYGKNPVVCSVCSLALPLVPPTVEENYCGDCKITDCEEYCPKGTTPPAAEVDWEELMLTDEERSEVIQRDTTLWCPTKGEFLDEVGLVIAKAQLAKVRQAMEGK